MNHLEHSIEALYDSSLKKLKRREEDIHLKTMVKIHIILILIYRKMRCYYQI